MHTVSLSAVQRRRQDAIFTVPRKGCFFRVNFGLAVRRKTFFGWKRGIFLFVQKAILLDAPAMDRALMRMAHEIVEREPGSDLVLAGIVRRGVPLAWQLAENIEKVSDDKVPVGALDVIPFRDDLQEAAPPSRSKVDFSVEGKTVILVDDVLFTGRTVRAALDALLEFGRPRAVRLAVLVDRGHRELPIRPDFVGKNIPTSQKERIEVRLPAFDNAKEVAILGQVE
jgi:pyrimidine operon attenuation protein/uracil phosphoribosyltransferase